MRGPVLVRLSVFLACAALSVLLAPSALSATCGIASVPLSLPPFSESPRAVSVANANDARTFLVVWETTSPTLATKVFAQMITKGETSTPTNVVQLGDDFASAAKASFASADGLFHVVYTQGSGSTAVAPRAMHLRVSPLTGRPVGGPVPLALLSTRAQTTPGLATSALLVWTDAVLAAVAESGTAPPIASRLFALVHTAIFEAVNLADRGYTSATTASLSVTVSAAMSLEAAAMAAAADVLVSVFPARRSITEALFNQQTARIPASDAKTEGLRVGRLVAAALLVERASDGYDAPASYTAAEAPGVWRPTAPAYAMALLPGWGNVRPWGTASLAAFYVPAMPALTSAQYASELAEVRQLGAYNSTIRTATQRDIARMWAGGPGTFTPPGFFVSIARHAVEQRGMGPVDAARALALVSMSVANAAIACWHDKFTHNIWRPITAIQRADEDGNAATEAEPSWAPLLATPPFPSYTSGHSTFSGAGSAALAAVLGTDSLMFTVSADGISRSFTSLAAAADEAGMSRIYGGIHFAADNVAGLASGRAIGAWVAAQVAPRPTLPAPAVTSLNVALAHAVGGSGSIAIYAGVPALRDSTCRVWAQPLSLSTDGSVSSLGDWTFASPVACSAELAAVDVSVIRPAVAYCASTSTFAVAYAVPDRSVSVVWIDPAAGAKPIAPALALAVASHVPVSRPDVACGSISAGCIVVWASATSLVAQRVVPPDLVASALMVVSGATARTPSNPTAVYVVATNQYVVCWDDAGASAASCVALDTMTIAPVARRSFTGGSMAALACGIDGEGVLALVSASGDANGVFISASSLEPRVDTTACPPPPPPPSPPPPRTPSPSPAPAPAPLVFAPQTSSSNLSRDGVAAVVIAVLGCVCIALLVVVVGLLFVRLRRMESSAKRTHAQDEPELSVSRLQARPGGSGSSRIELRQLLAEPTDSPPSDEPHARGWVEPRNPALGDSARWRHELPPGRSRVARLGNNGDDATDEDDKMASVVDARAPVSVGARTAVALRPSGKTHRPSRKTRGSRDERDCGDDDGFTDGEWSYTYEYQ